jgi:hypothetical protein
MEERKGKREMKQRGRIQRRWALALVVAGLLVDGVILGCALGLSDLDSSSLRTTVSDLDLTGRIPSPVYGAMPTLRMEGGRQYTGDVKWRPETGGTYFHLNQIYTAEVTLQAYSGYSFTGQDKFFHGGATEVSPGVISGDGKFITLTLKFPTTRDYLSFQNAVQLIKNMAGQPTLSLELVTGRTTVRFGTNLVNEGLVLTPSTSPAEVVINGRGGEIDLIGEKSGAPLITVGSGVTLTLRNITLKGLQANDPEDAEDNDAPLILVKSGGTLNKENGADAIRNGSVNAVKTEP